MLRSLALLLGVGAVWGLSFTLSRVVVSGGGHPFAIAFWQCLGGATILALLGRRPPRDAAHLRFFAVTGLLGAALPSTLVYTAAQHLSAGALSVCMALAPMAALGVCAALGIERIAASRAAGVALGLAAVWLLAAPEGGAPAAWALLAVGAACSYAAENVWLALRRPAGLGAFDALAGILAAAALMLAPLALATGRPAPVALRADPVLAAFLVQMLGNLLAYGGFVALVGRSGAIFASQVAYVVTLCGVAWGAAILGETHPPAFWLAAAVMLAGLFLTLPRGEFRRWTGARARL